MSEHIIVVSRKDRCAIVIGLLFACVALTPALAQSQEVWTLERSIQRVLDIAPEVKAARAEVEAREGALAQAGAWPNPGFEIRGEDKIGKDEGADGYDVTQFVFNQPLPLGGRLGVQRELAGAELHSAQAERRYQLLLLETQTAERFHSLQLTAARLRLAEQRLQLADELQKVGRRREQAGELARLERLRLDLIREAAQQILDRAEGEYHEALSQFRAHLMLPTEMVPDLVPLEPFSPIPPLEALQAGLPRQPALTAAKHRLSAARAGVDVARKERLPDPVLSLYRERDFLNGRRQDVNGIGLGITVPLWDRKSGRLREVRAQVDQASSGIEVLERDLSAGLKKSHLHLTHLVKQGEHFKSKVFEPASTVFELTRKAYAAGEMEILALIDANNTYFDANERYLELLQEAWMEAAELRLAAGRSLLTTPQDIEDTDHE